MKFKRQLLCIVTQYPSKMEVDISGLRKQCRNADEAFLEKDLVSKEPIGQFQAWYGEACAAKVLFPGAMCLATVSQEGFPSARYVICTSFSKDGFKFFTDYGSRKCKEMDNNPNVAATFYWAVSDRSVRIEGKVEKLSEEESTEAFKSRPVDAQVAIWASSQSIPIESKYLLGERLSELRNKLTAEKEVPKPSHWGGYIIRPSKNSGKLNPTVCRTEYGSGNQRMGNYQTGNYFTRAKMVGFTKDFHLNHMNKTNFKQRSANVICCYVMA